jgi:hypothetical protein
MNEMSTARAAITAARNEIAREKQDKAVKLLKDKLRARDTAATVLANIDREIADLELQIEQGNV